jgi:hypothetical protein
VERAAAKLLRGTNGPGRNQALLVPATLLTLVFLRGCG